VQAGRSSIGSVVDSRSGQVADSTAREVDSSSIGSVADSTA